jgi:20S proteasome alpha/beta subunit
MHPEPLYQPKSKRLPGRNAVTIIAGFKGYDGIVLCADTQETVSGFKRKVPKLRVEPGKDGADLAVAFCGAGHGPFIDKVVNLAWEDAQTATSLDDACSEIEKSIKTTHREFARIYQPGALPEIELVFGVKMFHGSRLFHAHGPTINERDYYSCGVGDYMADFLASRMYASHLDVRQLIILAAYILFQAKEYVEGCGGDSHIAVLHEDKESGMVASDYVDKLTELVNEADRMLAKTLISCANIGLKRGELKKNLKNVVDLIEMYRRDTTEELRQRKITGKYMFLGPLPTNDLGVPVAYKITKNWKVRRSTSGK